MTGAFNVTNNNPVSSSVQLAVLVKLNDYFATFINVALMAFFVLFITGFFICWKFFPIPFNKVMKKIIPELYRMTVQEKKKVT